MCVCVLYIVTSLQVRPRKKVKGQEGHRGQRSCRPTPASVFHPFWPSLVTGEEGGGEGGGRDRGGGGRGEGGREGIEGGTERGIIPLARERLR